MTRTHDHVWIETERTTNGPYEQTVKRELPRGYLHLMSGSLGIDHFMKSFKSDSASGHG